MDTALSPIVTVILNLVAGVLVSKGIIDSHSAAAFVQLANNILAALITIGLGVYSIYKTVEMYKHKISVASQTTTSTTSTPAIAMTVATTPGPTTTISSQTGLPLAK